MKALASRIIAFVILILLAYILMLMQLQTIQQQENATPTPETTGEPFQNESTPSSAQSGILECSHVLEVFVWEDVNGNAKEDYFERGFAGIKIALINSRDEAIRQAWTDDTGEVLFREIPIGTYKIQYTLPQGYTFTKKDDLVQLNSCAEIEQQSGINVIPTVIVQITSTDVKPNTLTPIPTVTPTVASTHILTSTGTAIPSTNPPPTIAVPPTATTAPTQRATMTPTWTPTQLPTSTSKPTATTTIEQSPTFEPTLTPTTLPSPTATVEPSATPTQTPVIESCPVPGDGRYVIDFNDELIRSDLSEIEARVGPIVTEIPSGYYDITLMHFDPNHPDDGEQPHESWFLVLKNESGETLVTTTASLDLPNNQIWGTSMVGEDILVADDITMAFAWHAAYPDESSPNSLHVACAVLDWQANVEPTGIPIPSNTPTPSSTPQITVSPTGTPPLPTITATPTFNPPTPSSTPQVTVSPTATMTPTPSNTLQVTLTPAETITPSPTAVSLCPGSGQSIYYSYGVQNELNSLCEHDGLVARVGLENYSELMLDMGTGNEIIDQEGIDFYYFEYPNGPGILLDHMELAVAPVNGQGEPGDFTVVFVWGDNISSNNGTIPITYLPESSERAISASDLHEGAGIGIDIGQNSETQYRFVRVRTFPASAKPGPSKGAEVDAIERIP